MCNRTTYIFSYCFLPFSLHVSLFCLFTICVFVCVWVCVCVCLYSYVAPLTLSVACLCVVDTVPLSTTSSLCLRPTTGPPSVSVFPTSTLNSSSLSTTSWSGTVQCSLSLPSAAWLHSSSHPHPMEHACVIHWLWDFVEGGLVADAWVDVCGFFVLFLWERVKMKAKKVPKESCYNKIS